MSTNNPTPTVTQLKMSLLSASRWIAQIHQKGTECAQLLEILTAFTTNSITPIVKHDQLYPSCKTPIQPTSQSDELKQIQSSLQALSRVVTGLQKKAPQPSKTPPPTNPMPSYASKASKPPNPSLVISLSHLSREADFNQPRPVEICSTLNHALVGTPHNQVHVAAARWTAKGNLIITGGHLTTTQQLQLTTPLLSKAFTDAYSTTVTPFNTPHTRANMKWSKLLINGLPTRVTNSRGAFTPAECHEALTSENPSYAPLIIAQKPNWVKPPSTYTPGSSSSLVVAFEDPDGTKARALLGEKHLYAFGTCAMLRKWKQHPTPPPQPPSDNDSESDVDIITSTNPVLPSSPFSFISSSVPADTTPTKW